MMSTNFHKGLFEYYRQRPVRFVDFLANPSDQAYFFKKFTSYVHYLVLDDSFFLRLCFYTSNANMLVYRLYLMVLQLHLRCRKKLVAFK